MQDSRRSLWISAVAIGDACCHMDLGMIGRQDRVSWRGGRFDEYSRQLLTLYLGRLDDERFVLRPLRPIGF